MEIQERIVGRIDQIGGTQQKSQPAERNGEDVHGAVALVQSPVEASWQRRHADDADGKQRQVADKLEAEVSVGKARAALSEQHAKVRHGGGQLQRRGAAVKDEDIKAEHDGDDCPNVSKHAGHFFQPFAEKRTLGGEQYEKVESPDDKVPCGAVPKSRQRPDDEQIEIGACRAAAIAPQRDIDVLAEPGGQRDVPTPPIVGERAGGQGVVEVFGEAEAQHTPQADGHVRIAGKVEIDLDGKAGDTKPRRPRGEAVGGHIPHALPKRPCRVGEQYLFGKARDKGADAAREVGECALPLGELLVHVAVPHDGARDELWEQCHIGAKGHGTLLCRDVAAVNVDNVGQCLESIERNADGKLDRELRQSREPRDGTQIVQDEAAVFEKGEQAEVDNDGGDQPRTGMGAIPLDEQTCGVVNGDGEDHQKEIDGLAPAVKNEARDEQYRVAGPPRDKKIEQQRQR